MKVLLFGSTGQVGQAFCSICPDWIDLVSLMRESVNLNLQNNISESIQSIQPDLILNAAAFTNVDLAETEREEAFAINQYAPKQIAHDAKKLGVPLIHISTDFVFDGSGTRPWEASDTPKPTNIYGKSKWAGEQEIIEAGCLFCILRTSWVFSENRNNFVKSIFKFAKSKESIDVVFDQYGGPTPALAIAKACLEIISHYKRNKFQGGIFHYSGSPNTNWASFAEHIIKCMNSNTKINKIPAKEYDSASTRPENSRLNCDSLFSTYNIERPEWRNSVAEAIAILEEKYEQ